MNECDAQLDNDTTIYCLLQQDSLQEQEDSESDSSLSQSPSVQDWLAQARTTRSQQHEDSLQRQRVHIHCVSIKAALDSQATHVETDISFLNQFVIIFCFF